MTTLPIPFSLVEALSDSLMPSISVASSSVLRRRDLLRRFAGKLDSLASVSAVWSVSVSAAPKALLSSWSRGPAAEPDLEKLACIKNQTAKLRIKIIRS